MSTTKTNHIKNIMNIAGDAWCNVDDVLEEQKTKENMDILQGVMEKLTSIEERCKLLLAMQGIEVEDE